MIERGNCAPPRTTLIIPDNTVRSQPRPPFMIRHQVMSLRLCLRPFRLAFRDQPLGDGLSNAVFGGFRKLAEDARKRLASDFLYDEHDEWTRHLEPPPAAKKSRRGKGTWSKAQQKYVHMDPKKSSWWVLYVDNDTASFDPRAMGLFRGRFRVPRDKILELVKEARDGDYFGRNETDACGRERAPLELLYLGAFRYLGRGWTFDDIAESTNISREVHRGFFHQFITIGSTMYYDRWVRLPQTPEEVEQCRREMRQAGFDGALASSDATHVIVEKCMARLKQYHSGSKESHTTRAYNLTSTHRRKILHSARGCPGRWCDKTLVLYDELLRGVQDGTLYQVRTPLGGSLERTPCPHQASSLPISSKPLRAFCPCLRTWSLSSSRAGRTGASLRFDIVALGSW